MASKPKQLLEDLTHPGPHDVLRGDLALVGLPGVVYTPARGLNLPAIAFGHGWLQPPGRYRELLRHLASWGIVAAAPATQRGPLPSHRAFAADLRSALDLVTGVRLGPDGISVDPAKVGLAGHSIGGGSAVLAAASEPTHTIRAVATITAAQTMPPATIAAQTVTAPGLHLVADEDMVAPAEGNAAAIADAWAGPVRLRTLPKSSHLAVTEGMHWSQPLLHGKPHRPTQRTVRALLTAFFLTELTGTDRYRPLLEADLKAAHLTLDREPAAR
ncbi:dienelactone hydrolase [Prauserella marina]|uniref:Dienelactone hydrolase n=1 Tax=Prauserella marina TaxID=530584 RepID=A0A222VJM4_9PSEU|nr:alpha/beta hydrolase [Prauserella marina]ASR34129.1 dienelactone hydrolase [Prauserella marina]PWV82773.1 dienelactone hydrolase [Prauserella marina]SDC76940.1 Dienelactone hydrolase [Prauserella marina]